MLAYLPQAAPLAYQSVDSGTITMDIPGMGAMQVTYDLAATRLLALAAADTGLDASITITRLAGQLQNPQSGTTAVDNTMIPAEAGRLRLSAAGAIARAELPALSRSLREVTNGATLFRSLFVRLPAAAVRQGASWVDTVEVSDQLGALSTSQRSEYHSTYEGDTVVDGRALARIRATVLSTVTVSGDAGGIQIEQRLVGKGTQTVLWDAARGVLVHRAAESDAAGSMTIVGAGMGDIPVTQRVRAAAWLVPGGG